MQEHGVSGLDACVNRQRVTQAVQVLVVCAWVACMTGCLCKVYQTISDIDSFTRDFSQEPYCIALYCLLKYGCRFGAMHSKYALE